MLTRKQLDLLRFIQQRMQECGVPPSFDEMKDALDLKSKSGIHRLITALEERGFLRRLPNRARAIEVIRLPDALGRGLEAAEAAAAAAPEPRRFTPSVWKGGLSKVPRRPRRPSPTRSSAASRFRSWAGSRRARHRGDPEPEPLRHHVAGLPGRRRALRPRGAW